MDAMSISLVVTIGGNQYTIWDEFQGSIDPSFLSDNAAAYVPATLVTSPTDDFTDEDLAGTVAQFSSDDVWSKEFLQGKCHTHICAL